MKILEKILKIIATILFIVVVLLTAPFIVSKVMDSYQDMLSGKGRDYKVFFAELESRYNGK